MSNGDPDSDQWPMLSIGTITAGAGYQYLTSEVASGAEDYYVRAGVGADFLISRVRASAR